MSTLGTPTLLILACHAPMASALHAVACHGFGMTLCAVRVLDVMSSANPQTVRADIESLWQADGRPEQVLILTDLLGATPSNGVSGWLAEAPSSRAGITGVSLPMLLRALSHREEHARSLAKMLQASAPDCISVLPEALNARA